MKLLGDSVKKIFLTGGAGFIGSHIVDWLIMDDYEVTVYDNLCNGKIQFLKNHLQNPKFKFLEKYNDFDSLMTHMAGHDLIWHLAANTDIIGGVENPKRDLRDCVVGTFNIMKQCVDLI